MTLAVVESSNTRMREPLNGQSGEPETNNRHSELVAQSFAESKFGAFVPGDRQQELLAGLDSNIKTAAGFEKIRQGNDFTCAVGSAERALAATNPARYVEVVRELAINGETTLANGLVLKFDAKALTENALGANRNLASAIFQIAVKEAVNGYANGLDPLQTKSALSGLFDKPFTVLAKGGRVGADEMAEAIASSKGVNELIVRCNSDGHVFHVIQGLDVVRDGEGKIAKFIVGDPGTILKSNNYSLKHLFRSVDPAKSLYEIDRKDLEGILAYACLADAENKYGDDTADLRLLGETYEHFDIIDIGEDGVLRKESKEQNGSTAFGSKHSTSLKEGLALTIAELPQSNREEAQELEAAAGHHRESLKRRKKDEEGVVEVGIKS